MARRGGRGGRSSGGRSSRGRSSSRSRGRSSSRSSKSRSSSKGRAKSTSSRSKSRATSSKRTATRRTTRTRTTRSAPRRTAAVKTTRATPRRVNVRPVYVNRATAATVKPRLTGGRFATPQQLARGTLQQRQATFQSIMSKQGRPVNVTFANGKTRRMSLSPNAIRTYQNSGLKVTPVSFTLQGGMRFPTPAIPRITNPSIAWSKRPPKQLHVSANTVAPPRTKNLESFGGTGNNPWNPFDALGGLFGMPPQQNPETQYMPQEQKNIINPDRPVYTSFASGAHQAAAFEQSRAGFNSNIIGTGAQSPTSFDAKQEIQNLINNKYALYAGLAIGGLFLVKMISGGGGRGAYR